MPFSFTPGPLAGLVLVTPRRFLDPRGWFQETYKRSEFVDHGIPETFVQDNLSYSSKGTLRGLHFQKGNSAQGKLVSVLAGAVWDVAVDLRVGSPTRGKWYGVELRAEEAQLFYIPPGFAHGFVALTDGTLFSYKCTAEYDKPSEAGLLWNDPELNIAWPLTDVQVSEKDALLPTWAEFTK
ncbi:MAG: dTDP-4-dehydrorhamnose 3,5-epimerase [Spirochaetales bacterium]|nr:dTDP-4-dehydrorhamnose 3,5-epimerase [Spirochaetales bacterium]